MALESLEFGIGLVRHGLRSGQDLLAEAALAAI